MGASSFQFVEQGRSCWALLTRGEHDETALGIMRVSMSSSTRIPVLFQLGCTGRRETCGNHSGVDAQRKGTVRDSRDYVKGNVQEGNVQDSYGPLIRKGARLVPWSRLLEALASAARRPSRFASRDGRDATPSPQAAREEYRPLRPGGR